MHTDGVHLLTAATDNKVRYWDITAKDDKPLREWALNTIVRNVAFDSKNNKGMTANGNTTLYLLELP